MIGILRSAFMLVAAIAIVGGGTYSYFSTKDDSVGNTISTGSLSIDLRNQNTTDPLLFSIPNLLPGGTALVNFDVQNNSATGVQIRGAAFGEWVGVTSPNNALIKVVKIERWNGSAWQEIQNVPAGITGLFYDSPNGSDGSNYTVPASDKAQFQLTLKLDESAGDKYQGKSYSAAVKVQARQDGASTWPTDLDAQFE